MSGPETTEPVAAMVMADAMVDEDKVWVVEVGGEGVPAGPDKVRTDNTLHPERFP